VGGPSSGSNSLGKVVDQALRDVLGYKVKQGDVKGFTNALNQSFQLVDDEGHTDFKWIQRSYATSVDADMGAVTGAQASILTRAKVAVDQCLPLLDGLYALDTETLVADIDSIKSIIRSELLELVAELSIVGGPRVARVDELFLVLTRDPEEATENTANRNRRGQRRGIGHLAELRNRLGFERIRINTIDDEQNYTNYLILRDYVNGLLGSWNTYRPYFTRAAREPFLGTNLVLISRALTAVAETVNEATFAMDSVFLGPEERQTLELNYGGRNVQVPNVRGDIFIHQNPKLAAAVYQYTFPQDAAPLFISELLDWVYTAVTDQATDLIQNSGKDGLNALYPTLDQLRRLVHGAMIERAPYHGAQRGTDTLTNGYKSDRVQLAMKALATQLDEAAKLVGEIYQPSEEGREELPYQDILDALKDPEILQAIREKIRG